MPPKKDNKKKGGGSGPKEVDSEAYVRQPIQFPDLNAEQIGTDAPLGGTYYGISAQFSEWTVEGENWDAPVPEESLIPIRYPPVVRAAAEKPVIEFLKLNEEVEGAADAGKKGKKEAPKKGKGPAEVTEEAAYDEHGRALPRVFVDSASAASAETPPDGAEAAGVDLVRPFRRAADGGGEGGAAEPGEESGLYTSEVDPLMCAAFEMVRRFSATLTANDACPYLWRAIYPQLPDGRPRYNPAGRYCVKLFVAGAWRKVYVNDNVPVSDSGEPAVASSAAPQELWPMLLAKAVYTVYTALGYHTLFESLGLANAAPSATDKASAFVALALHTLTGWLPTAPMAIPAGSDEDRGSFLQDIAFGGCRCISLEEKIRSEALSTSEIEVDESAYEGKLTQKIIKDLQETKRVKREHLKKVVCKREADIRATTAALSRVHSEPFCLVLTNPEGTRFRVFPVLTIASQTAAPPAIESYAPGSPTSTRLAAGESPHLSPVKLPRPTAAAEPSQLSSVQLLVEWSLLGPRPTGLQPEVPPAGLEGGAEEGQPAAERKEEEWEASTELHQKWVPFSEFCDSMSPEGHEPFGVSVVSFETRSRAAQSQQMLWGWAAAAEPSEAAGKGKAPAKPAGKDKKGGAADAAAGLTPLGVPIAGADQGLFPPTLLSIDVSGLCKEGETAAPAEGTDAPAATEEGGDAAAEGAGQPAAAELQLAEPTIGGVEKPDPTDYVAVMVHLQGEILASLGDTAPPPAEDGAEGAAAPAAKAPVLADDVVLVLQEVRRDEDEPLVMRVALTRAEALTPITRTTFHIPISRIRSSPNGGKLTFWVRLFTKGSVLMTFASPCALSLGPAEAVWQSAEEGVATVIDGESSAVRSNVEAILFRASFLAPDPDAAADPAPAEGAPEGSEDAAAVAPAEEAAPAAAPNLTSSCIAGSRVMVFLHISDRRADRFASLVGLSGGFPEECTALPRLGGNVLQLTPAASAAGPLAGQLSMALVAKIFLAKDSLSLSGFKWRLVILSRKETPLTTRWCSLPPPSAGPSAPSATKRFGGCYTPNNKLVLFRDQLAGVMNEAPLALRVAVLPFSYGESGSESSVWLNVRLINPSTRAVVREYRGRGVVPIYAVDLKQFVTPEGPGNAAASDKKGKKDEKKGAKGGASSDEVVNFIVECALDENLMEIPPEWRSRFPYVYSEHFPPSLADDATAQQKIAAPQASVVADGAEPPKYSMPDGAPPPAAQGPQWVMDVLGGSVHAASHDLFDLTRFNNAKNSWLERSSDRFDRAAAAVAYNAARLGPRSEEAEDEVLGLLAAALDSTAEALKPAEALLPEIPDYKEHITVLGDYQIPAVAEPQTDEQKEQLAKEAADLDSEAQSAIDALAALNGLIKEDVTKRMEQSITKFEKYNGELREAWQAREKARLFLDTQNSTLTFLLGRVAEAKAKVFQPEEDPKKKGAKKK